MPSVLVDVAPVSPLSLDSCAACGAPGARSVCAACGSPQAIRAGETYFSVFGLEPRFGLSIQTREAIESVFLALSRQLHPDRFASEGGERLRLSQIRMSFLNQALTTLRSPALRREYVLELLAPVAGKKPTGLPLDWAERWFEIQDTPAALAPFDAEVAAEISATEAKILGFERVFDESGAPATLAQVREGLYRVQTLASLRRDIARLRGTV